MSAQSSDPHSSRPVYFTHIPRCGGTSLISFLSTAVRRERRYPNAALDEDPIRAKIDVSYLLDQPRSRLGQTDLFAPHMPHAVHELLGLDLFTVTLVRDPVDRVRSLLDMMARAEGDAASDPLMRSFEESEWARSWFFANQITNLLGLTATQITERLGHARSVDDAELPMSFVRGPEPTSAEVDVLVRSACDRLETIDALGLTESAPTLYELLGEHLGISTADVAWHNRGRGTPVSAALRRKIEEATAADREVYYHARELVARRGATPS